MFTLILLGAAVGLVMALTGAGGGIFSVPLLVIVLALPVQTAAPVALLAVAVAAAIGAFSGLVAGKVRYKAALLMAAFGLTLSPFGVWLAQRSNTIVLSLLFAAVLLWVAFNAFKNSWAPKAILHDPIADFDMLPEPAKASLPCVRNPRTGRFIWTMPCARALAASGSVAGLLSGLLGVGGGFVLIPALQRFTDLDVQSTALTSLAVIAIVSGFGVLAYSRVGGFDGAIALPFAAGAVAGMLGGRLVAGQLNPMWLRRAFGVLCLAVASLMVWKVLA